MKIKNRRYSFKFYLYQVIPVVLDSWQLAEGSKLQVKVKTMEEQ